MTYSIAVVPIGSADPLAEPSLARELAGRFLVWDAFVAGKRRVDVHPLLLPAALHAQAVETAEAAVREVGRVAASAHDDAAERRRYRFDDDTLRLARASRDAGDDASLMRVDLLLDAAGRWKACEINADCPGGHNEALGLPWLARAAGFAHGTDPTHVVDALVARLRALAGGGAVGIVHATGYAEDLQVSAMVERRLRSAGIHAVRSSPSALHLRGDDLCLRGEPVRALYRYFPTEWMTGFPSVAPIVRAVAGGRVRTISSFAHVFCQSKLSLARTWERAKSSSDEGQRVRAWLPETLEIADVARDELVSRRARWVIKRALGRVGDEVFVGALAGDEQWVRLVEEVRARTASGESWIAQQFVEQQSVPTPWGPRFVTLGAYVLDGRFVGYFARLTPISHVSHDALCVPVFASP